MLALTRRVGEEIVIGDPRKPLGTIRIVEIHGDKVRLSFDFPKEILINRRELAEQKARQGSDGGPGAGTPGLVQGGPAAPAESADSGPPYPFKPLPPAPPNTPPGPPPDSKE